jgi:cyclophilin family peptidyl-prolyl cis-trans isomerase
MTSHKKRSSKHNSQRKLWLAIGIIAIIIIAIGVYQVLGNSANQTTHQPSPTPTATQTATPTSSASDPEYGNAKKVSLHTTIGDITIALRNDKPITTTNFIDIVKSGWYDQTTFYRTMTGFMIQGGKISQSHTVSAISDEIGSDNHNVNYTIAMAKTSSPNSATSEFFINAGDNSKIIYPDGSTFDGTYTVFGKVISGQNIVDEIANAAVTANPYTGELSVPVNPVTIISATIIP